MTSLRLVILLACSAGLLVSCGGKEAKKQAGVREILGLERNAPDEFRVVSRPPLSVPQEFYLTPPSHEDGLSTGGASPTTRRAQEIISPVAVDTVTPEMDISQAEQSFLQRAGASEADAEIRQKLGQENWQQQQDAENKSILDRLSLDDDAEPLIDASKERERILDNREQGKPLNEGEIPTMNPNGDTPLEKLLNKL